jgi:leucyl/phenylalanyl-tRNA--protein transferase
VTIWRLPADEVLFPDPLTAEPDGLIGVDGSISPDHLLAAYREGIFPWNEERERTLWFFTHPRCVLDPARLHVPSSLKSALNRFEVRRDTAFEDVLMGCVTRGAPSPSRRTLRDTWLYPALRASMTTLHHRGVAHSFEAWRDGRLVGGLYGLKFGSVFCGESMFFAERDASKVAFVRMVACARASGITLIDCQQDTEHIRKFGAVLMSGADYLAHLRRERDRVVAWAPLG